MGKVGVLGPRRAGEGGEGDVSCSWGESAVMVVGRCDDALLELVGDVGVLVCVRVFILTGDFPSWYFATRDWGGGFEGVVWSRRI